MRTLAVDGKMGASGDMLLGALLAVGADPSALSPVEDALAVTYRIDQTERNGISAVRVVVALADSVDSDAGGVEIQDTNVMQSDSPPAVDEENHTQAAEDHSPARSFSAVLETIEAMTLPGSVEADAKSIFQLLGEAEATVHGTDLNSTHFHEIGAIDAIADVVGVALLIDDLDPQRIVTTPIATGDGHVEMSHGIYPIPTPAVVEIAELADWKLRGGPVEKELLTPTGAAILAHYAQGVESLPAINVDSSGYAAGSYEFAEHPNVLRILLGECIGELQQEEITVLETNLDDVTPEILGGLQQTLADVGALDVSIVPTVMKKSRPGHLIKVIVKPENAERVAQRLASETGTLGVREFGGGHRWIANREIETVTIDIAGDSYDVGVKVGSTNNQVYDISAEFDDALAVAQKTELTVREIMRRAERVIRESLDD